MQSYLGQLTRGPEIAPDSLSRQLPIPPAPSFPEIVAEGRLGSADLEPRGRRDETAGFDPSQSFAQCAYSAFRDPFRACYDMGYGYWGEGERPTATLMASLISCNSMPHQGG